ncbi:MAG: aminotransferase class I/II-fold pyridoxal phosphate-dependent enzyme [Hyphomicrobiaceae bacterium]|jgi:8-amino-7-oxononanoate synthase
MTNQDVGSREGSWLEAVERAPGGVKGAARSLARALGTIRPVESEPAFKPALPFGELHIFQTMNKHRSVASMFGLRNPFYHAHEGRLGATTRSEGRELINYASYDYLGLNQEPAVAAAAKAAIDEFGTSVSASRLVAGERMMHREFEQEMADFYGSDACLAFVSGHATNISTIGVLMGPEDLIVQDELMHNSALVGGKLSRATSINFRHNNLDDLEKVLRENRAKHKNALILAEGLYSMDGDFPDLPRLIQLKKRYGCWLMMDEAHSLGVMGKNGRGSFEHFGVDPREVDIWMGTLSKTLGSCGGYICGSNDLIEILKYQAPGFVYSVGLSPPATAAALAALRILKSDPARIARLQANGHLFVEEAKKAGLDTMTSAGYSVVPVMVGDPVRAVRLTDRLVERGINALPIIHPAVPMKAARIRFFMTSKHTPEQIRLTVKIVAEELASIAKRQSLMERATLAVVAR